jgi:hypothetical protein
MRTVSACAFRSGWCPRSRGPARSRRASRCDFASTLKLLERLHGLPTLASMNHLFDAGTPTGGNFEANGAPAPPRDAREEIGDLLDCFDF